MKNTNIILFLIPIVLFACEHVYERGNGNISTENRAVKKFSELEIDGMFDVILQKGKSENVKVLTDENLHKYVDIYVKKGRLVVEATENIKSDEGIKVYITYDRLESIELKGASVVSTESIITSKEFHIEVKGAGVMDLELDVKALEVKISGAGLLELNGNADEVIIKLDGAGNLSAYDLECEILDIELSGIGAAQVNVSERFFGKITGVGSINYKGDPEIVEIKITGLGKINPTGNGEKSDVQIDI
jgi:putative autotransporter adhesin-like protein